MICKAMSGRTPRVPHQQWKSSALGARAPAPPAGNMTTAASISLPGGPNGVNQVLALVGTVIRAKPHGGAPAGYVASFIAVKRP